MTVDYERYARERPIFWGDYAYPRLFVEAAKRSTGTYADIGAGDGGQIRSALDQSLLAGYSRIVAVDIAEERLARIGALLPGVECVLGDAQQLPLGDDSVDFAYSSQVIEHVADDVRMAREIRRVLKPGASAVIGSALRLRGAWYFYRYRGRWVLDPTHVREYRSADEYTGIFQAAGFAVDAIEIEPIRYAISDLVLRALFRLRLMDPLAANAIYHRSGVLRRLREVRVSIPRYRHIFALVRKASGGTFGLAD